MRNQLTPKQIERILSIIESKLPSDGKVVCLSLTGSRSYGWASEKSDWDIRGIFSAKNHWDWVHYSYRDTEIKAVIDISLYRLQSFLSQSFPSISFEFFREMANPIYLDQKFDYKGLMSFCYPQFCHEPEYDLIMFEKFGNVKNALQAYRILMIQINFLKTNIIETNIFELNQKFKFKILSSLRKKYQEGKPLTLKEREEIKKDLEKLLNEFRETKNKKVTEIPIETQRWKAWQDKMKKLYT